MLALNHQSKEGFSNSLSHDSAKVNNWFPFLFGTNNNQRNSVENQSVADRGFIYRVTPFLLFSTFLMGFFPFLMITHQGPVQNELLLAFMFPFTVASIFYTDTFLWNYFKGKKLFNVWALEMVIALFFGVITQFI